MTNKDDILFFDAVDDKFERESTFKHNRSDLKSDDGENVDEQEFRNLIAKVVRQFVRRPFDNIVLLVGAGASVVISDGDIDANFGKTVSQISKDAEQQLENGKYTLDNAEVEVFTLDEVIDKVMYNFQVDDDDFNFEDLISRIIHFKTFVNPKDLTKFDNTHRAIEEIIKKDTSYNYDSKFFRHAAVLKVLSNLLESGKKLNVVTTNYDTVIEEAADSISMTVFDGFSFTQKPKFDGAMFDWNLVKDVPNVSTRELIYKPSVMNLLKIHGSLTWEYDYQNNVVRQSKDFVKKPIMVFPSSDKYSQSYQQPYFDLFVKFQELLKQPNTLLITTGFSFADNHISQMIISSIKANNGLSTLVSDFKLEGTKNDNWEQLQSLKNQHFDIAFLKATMNGDLADYLGGNDGDNR
ncbi:SIR2 family protein [Weissella cibaria]|uniref:SIR2 family protein n=1 Tax=Weissella cibaria TaxID=137591 RepID=UPI001C1F973B|nr:SIR2 family protein [Weissella cibaria]MBU7544760.1 SIR2 family protein [Weissella cibaria]MCV3317737.1 SIR2 family protein [Weissella cibaria]